MLLIDIARDNNIHATLTDGHSTADNLRTPVIRITNGCQGDPPVCNYIVWRRNEITSRPSTITLPGPQKCYKNNNRL